MTKMLVEVKSITVRRKKKSPRSTPRSLSPYILLGLNNFDERQAELLNKRLLQKAQRVNLASQIGKLQGNRHLQRVIVPGGQAGKIAGLQLHAVQRQVVDVAALGVAVFAEGRALVSSGNLYHNANTPSYMHERTPAEVTWEDVETILHVKAFHPRYFIDAQDFYYRLTYQRNGYDIRNAQVDILRDRSSSMISSTFGSTWSGQTHSRPNDRVCQIVFNISGEWDPVGRGFVSWWGRLILSAAKGGSPFQSFTVGSERNWVYSAT